MVVVTNQPSSAPLPCLMYWRRDIFSLIKKMVPVVVHVENGLFTLYGPDRIVLQAPVDQVQVRFTHWATMEVRCQGRLMKARLVHRRTDRTHFAGAAQPARPPHPLRGEPRALAGASRGDAAASLVESISELDFGKSVQFFFVRKRSRALQDALPLYGVPVRRSGMHAMLYLYSALAVVLVLGIALGQ